MQTAATDEVLIRREGRAGRITMNRPKALNALTLADGRPHLGRAAGLARTIRPSSWCCSTAPAIAALCAGGDVRSLYESRTQGSALASDVLARRVPAQRADRPLSQAVRGDPGRHRHGRRHWPVRPRPPPHRHGALAARHAGDRHRPDPRRRRHLAAGARAGRDRHLPRAHGRSHARGRCHLLPVSRCLCALSQAPRAGAPSGRSQRRHMSPRRLRRWPRSPGHSELAARRERDRPRLRRADRRGDPRRRWRQRRATGRQRPLQRWRRNPQGAEAHLCRHPQRPRPDLAGGRTERWSTA